ncbi:MAG: F420-dependent methylenetetrahydromethanopterin dehydrogenase [Thermoproteota archaeon]|nr:MAG: F420-dependent methylenetetrahydromethanopterin dehydrogenase [Candidatus Korarchaeota archaeon]
MEPVRVGFGKLGNIATSLIVELLLDERAERKDIDVRVVSSGAKLGEAEAEEVARRLMEFSPRLAVVSSPNAALKGPTLLRRMLKEAGIPVIVVSDEPAKRAIKSMEEEGFGYIIVEADSMIGARREFLDPAEMALYNAYVLTVLACTGALNAVFKSIDRVIEQVKQGAELELPRLVVNAERALSEAGFQNPYALAKARAAYEAARKVAELTVRGCFIEKDWTKYTVLVAAAHELMRLAARMAEEAREIEKYSDSVMRVPHHSKGHMLVKRRLIEKPAKVEGG